jgi:hypothetical protein
MRATTCSISTQLERERVIRRITCQRACEILAHGEFFGIFEQKREIPHFSLALISPDEVWLKGVRHSHTTTHIIFVLCGEYV